MPSNMVPCPIVQATSASRGNYPLSKTSVDTEGHLLSLEVIPANIQDRDCAAGLIERALKKYPRLKKIFADGGYAEPKLAMIGVMLKRLTEVAS